MTLVAMIATLATLGSCKKEDLTPTIEFQDKICTVYSQSSVDVTVNLDKAAPVALSVPVEFTSDAVKGTDYTVSAEAFTFAQGATSSTITITDNGMKGNTAITLKLKAGEGFYIGTNYTAVVSKDAEEALIYSFNSTKADLIESAKISISIIGEKSGSKFMASEDIEIPFVLDGEGADAIDTESNSFVIKKGSNSASVTLTRNIKAEEFSSDPKVTLSIDKSGNSRLTPGEINTVTINVLGQQKPSKLVGTWNFSRVYDIDELEMWFEEYDDDPDLLPTHNEGFTLTFTEDENTGVVTLTPGGKGDLLNYFREATVTMTTPINYSTEGELLGEYTVKELNMFMAEDPGLEDGVVFTYYLLSCANRDFSADSENIGESVIAFRLTDSGLEMQLRDYDCPPFGEMWWDDDFDADMFSFASLFTKAE